MFDANGNQISIPASGITVSGNCQNVGGYGCTSSAAALVDGNTGTGWNAGETRPGCNWANSATCALVSGETDSGYFTIDLGSPMVISRVSLLAENTPDPANATYQVLGSTDGSNFTLLATMNGTGVTTNNDWIDFVLPSGLSNVRAQGTPFKSASSFSGPPTATITVNGGSTANTGYTQEVLLSWSSQNADGATFGWTNTANCNAFIPPAFGTGIILGGPTPPLTGNKFNGQYALELACRQNGSATVTYKTSQLATGLTATASVTINVSGNGMTVMSPVYLAPSNNYSGSTGIQTQVGGIGAGSESTLPTLSVGTVPAGLTATVGAYVNQNSQIVPGTDVNALGTAPITITGSAATPPGLYIVTINSTPAFGATGYSNVTSTYEIVVGVTTSTNPTCTFNDTCNN